MWCAEVAARAATGVGPKAAISMHAHQLDVPRRVLADTCGEDGKPAGVDACDVWRRDIARKAQRPAETPGEEDARIAVMGNQSAAYTRIIAAAA